MGQFLSIGSYGILSFLAPMLWGLFKKYSRLPKAVSALVEHDRLEMMEAVAFQRTNAPDIGKRPNPRRVIRVVVIPLQGLMRHRHHRRPPRTLRFVGEKSCSLLSLSRSTQSPSILVSILSSKASAEAVEIPALRSCRISPRCRWIVCAFAQFRLAGVQAAWR
jgi:hypothetical protein